MKASRFLVFSGLITGLCYLGSKVEAAPVGMAAHVSGKVSVTNDGQKMSLRLLDRVEDGDTINCGPGSSAIVVLFGNGERYQVGAGKSANVRAAAVQGGQRLAELSGPSASAVKLLGSARVGAASSRQAKTLQRLLPDWKGYVDSAAPHFEWMPVPNASTYKFTLYDDNNNVLLLNTTPLTSFTFSSPSPKLQEKRPYLWTLGAFNAAGKSVTETRGGLVTLLSKADMAALEVVAADLQSQAKTATDSTPISLLAEVYLSYGVTGRALEILDDERLQQDSGIADAKADIYASLSSFARAMAGPAAQMAPSSVEQLD